jgi:hypothetical protein
MGRLMKGRMEEGDGVVRSERMEWMRLDDGEEMERENEGGCWEWIEADGECKRKVLERTWVG